MENRIPFELKLEEEPNETTIKAIEEGKIIAKNESIKGYDSTEELKKALGV